MSPERQELVERSNDGLNKLLNLIDQVTMLIAFPFAITGILILELLEGHREA